MFKGFLCCLCSIVFPGKKSETVPVRSFPRHLEAVIYITALKSRNMHDPSTDRVFIHNDHFLVRRYIYYKQILDRSEIYTRTETLTTHTRAHATERLENIYKPSAII